MLLKSPCQHCGNNLEFEAEMSNQFCTCPHCGQQTRLITDTAPRTGTFTGKTFKATVSAAPTETRMTLCPDCQHTISPRALWCPRCGAAGQVRFSYIWHIVGNVLFAVFIYSLIGGIIGCLIAELIKLS